MIDELRQEMLAEQAQRLARLELRNRIHMIGLLIWGTLLLGWMIYCFVKLMVMANRTAIMQAGTIPFTCGTCGAAFDLPAEYLVKHPFIPKKSISAGQSEGAGFMARSVCPEDSGALYAGKRHGADRICGKPGKLAQILL